MNTCHQLLRQLEDVWLERWGGAAAADSAPAAAATIGECDETTQQEQAEVHQSLSHRAAVVESLVRHLQAVVDGERRGLHEDRVVVDGLVSDIAAWHGKLGIVDSHSEPSSSTLRPNPCTSDEHATTADADDHEPSASSSSSLPSTSPLSDHNHTSIAARIVAARKMIAALRGQFQEQQRAVVDVVEQCERLRASMGFMKEVQDCNDADDDNETDDAHVKNDDVHHGHNDDDVYDDVFADWKLLHADDNLHRRTISTPSWHATKTTWLTTPTQSKLAECQHALDYLQALQSHLRMKITTLVETITMLLRRLDRPTGDVSALCGSASLSTVRSLIVTARHLERDVREREERVRELQGRIMDMACGMGRTVPDFRQGGGIDDALLSDEVITELEMLVTSWMDEWNGYREARIQQLLVDLADRHERYYIPLAQRRRFLATIEKDPTSEATYVALRREIQRLDDEFGLAVPLLDAIQQRNDHVAKMKAFEQSASDPRRLFRSSFQLLDEERFRKVAYPTLVKLEDVIRTRLMEVERVKGRPFVLDFGDDEEDHGRESGENGGDADFAEPYAEVLRREVEARYVNETVFAFFRGAVKSAASTKASASSSASSASSTKPSTPSTKLAQRKAPPAIVVDQENLDKQAANIPATPATPQIEKVKPVVARPSTGSAASTMSTTKTKTSASIKRTPMARHQRPPVMK